MFLSICEIMSTIIGALAGSIASSRVKMDLFGVIVCGEGMRILGRIWRRR